MSDDDRAALDDCLNAMSIDEGEYKTFLGADCQVDCSALKRCAPGTQLVDWQAMPLVSEMEGKASAKSVH